MSFRMFCAVSAFALLAGCAQNGPSPEGAASFEAASLGYDAYKNGDLSAAQAQFQSALSSDPNNPYALLGLGAVNENSGNLDAAQKFYTAADVSGASAPASFTYITEQRIERASNISVATLAQENLSRLSVKRAALAGSGGTGFASYDGETAIIGESSDISYDVPAVPATYSTTEPSSSGEYENIGSYDSYIASTGGGGTVYAEPEQYDIEPATFGSEITYESEIYVEPVDLGTGTPYYDSGLNYEDTSVVEPSTYQIIEPTTYEPATYTPAPQVTQSGPAGPLLQYGQAFGDPVDLIAQTGPADVKDAYFSGATSLDGTGGLIYLGN